ncbi:hypothetical protein O7635_14510 [Asanoa sp. WMMD1127]|uniref:hypothetical protein n=1 Tax=Asanoa sp. WMMD1127 TaxID=3016107 RepID=UPI002416284E|nr:hypothetical protein [Asanoa sp. WMMD1127]MDG4823064.1 hypothetical protein [Asanoa sp. WMMD1127]
MAMFLVMRERAGPRWQAGQPLEAQDGFPAHAEFMDALVAAGVVVLGGPLADDVRVALAVKAESAESVASTLAADPWTGSHLRTVAVDPWTIRLGGRV